MSHSSSLLLDAQGQNPMLYGLYTQISIIYSLPDSSRDQQVVETLRIGLDHLREGFPWLAGDVVNNNGSFIIKPSTVIPLVTRDLRQDTHAPTIQALQQENFPMHLLDEKLIAPCQTLNPGGVDFGNTGKCCLPPVLGVQMNFITGGLVLTIVAQHNVMDMAGQFTTIKLLDKACRNIPFSTEELAVGGLDRSQSIEMLPDLDDPELDSVRRRVDRSYYKSAWNDPQVSCSWANVTFTQSSLEKLKAIALATKNTDTFVSTDDVVCAFIWKCISRARSSRIESTTLSTFARAIDMRVRMGLPTTYMGNIVGMTYSSMSLHQLASEPLGAIASQLRQELDPSSKKLPTLVRAMASLQAQAQDKSDIGHTVSLRFSTDIALSSWVFANLYDLDFNFGLGKPLSVRRPRFTPVKSLIYLLPKSPSGEIVASICISEEDWMQLRSDEEFSKYTTYNG